MKKRSKFALLVILAALALGFSSSQGYGFDTELAFHGRVQSTAILRDITGFQYGVLDDNQWVGWQNEIQFDLALQAKYAVRPPLRIDKAYLSFRGDYDAIYDVLHRYDDIPDSGRSFPGGHGSRYDLGRDDVHSLQDLREIFVDILLDAGENTEKCPQNAHLRLGRQIVMWGEADGFNLVNIVNPQDLRGVSSFAAPDDLANPIWMARLDLNSGSASIFNNLSAQFLFIPDVRPTVWGPAGSPYGLGLPQNDHPTGFHNPEYGLRLGALWRDLQTYLYFFDGYENFQGIQGSFNLNGVVNPALFKDFGIDHPRIQMYGISFTRPWDWWHAVLRGEASITHKNSWNDLGNLGFSDDMPGYSLHNTTRAYFGIDKPFSATTLPLGTDSALSTTVQVYYQHISGWDYDSALRGQVRQDKWAVIALASNDYFHGQISPSLFAWWECGRPGSTLFSPAVSYTPDYRWFFKLSATMYLGDAHSPTTFAPYIGGYDELAFQVKYQW